MKNLSCIIILFFLGITGNAQTFLTDTSYKDQIDLPAQIDIHFSRPANKNLTTLFFLAFDNDTRKKAMEKSFDEFCSSAENNFNKVKIVFHNTRDSVIDYRHIATTLMGCDLFKEYKGITKENCIISGVNEGAVIAFYLAALFPETIQRTGCFTDGYAGFLNIKDEFCTLIPKIKGKAFIDILNEDKGNAVSSLADLMALNAGIMIYKIDGAGSNKSKNIFNEFYKWAIADGNNYIIDLK